MGLQITGTPYFRTVNGRLRRALKIQLPESYSGAATCHLTAADETFSVDSVAENGSLPVCGLEAFEREVEVMAVIESAHRRWQVQGRIPPTRRWTIHITQGKHLDYGWIHPVEQVIERVNVMVDFALDHPMRWNFDTSMLVEEYLKARPSVRGDKLLDKLRSGEFETAANWLVPAPGILSVEEMVHFLGYANTLRAQGIPVQTALMQEAPSLAWGMATVLAGAGFPYLIKGAYDLRNPHLKEREPYPLAWWEGADGSRVLLRWDLLDDPLGWGGYDEAYPLWRKNTRAEKVDYIEKTIARYEAYAHYPWSALLLAGSGADEFPQTTAITDFIASFTAEGWDYPRLVDATWKDFWQAIDPERAPVLRGDWGTAWEEWAAQIARLSNTYRRARQTVFSAQTLCALTQRLDPSSGARRVQALQQAWRGLLQFAEHDFGGICPEYAEDIYETKAGYARAALREGTRALESSITTLAARLPQSKDGRALVVANPNNWQRGGSVEVVLQDAIPYEVLDAGTMQPIPCQLETRGPGWMQHYLSFIATDIPGFGYRTYIFRRGEKAIALSEPAQAEANYENDFYRLTINSVTGGLESLFDKQSSRELVLPGSYALNEYLHHSDGTLQRAQLQAVSLRRGVVCDHLITEVTSLRAKIRTTYKLYHANQCLEIVNELYKEASSEPQASWFAFPFNHSQPRYQYDGMAAILRPGLQTQGGDLLPGSGLSTTAVQSFLSVSGEQEQITLATPDAYLFQFGEQVLNDPLGDSDPRSSLALSLALHNFTRNDHLVRQSGQEYFTFRYSLELGRPSTSQAAQFAAEYSQSLPRAWVTGEDNADLPLSDSMLSVTPENIIATGLKVAEDGKGWVLRLWECDGRETTVTVNAAKLGATRAWACNLLEEIQSPLMIRNGVFSTTIPARGLKAVRFD